LGGLHAAAGRSGLRRDLTLELLNGAGQVAKTYAIHNAWVSEIQALPDLDANANTLAIQHLKLENEGVTELRPKNKVPLPKPY
jgi:phage tail-like protein